MIIYENESYLVLHLGKCMNYCYEKIRKPRILWYIINFKDAYLVLLCGKLIKNIFDNNEVENLTQTLWKLDY